MALLGAGAMAMWWDITPEAISEFEEWHTREHMPERASIPGFLRSTRGISVTESPRYFALYEVDTFETLISQPYLERLNNPTPWAQRMMVHYRNMTRSLCRISSSFGSGVTQTLMTMRISPVEGKETALRAWLTQEALPGLSETGGIAGAHLLETRQQPHLPQTREQLMRGGDATADWVILVQGYGSQSVISLAIELLGMESLAANGASPDQITCVYQLDYSLSREEMTHGN